MADEGMRMEAAAREKLLRFRFKPAAPFREAINKEES
jgi:hypothetical protein